MTSTLALNWTAPVDQGLLLQAAPDKSALMSAAEINHVELGYKLLSMAHPWNVNEVLLDSRTRKNDIGCSVLAIFLNKPNGYWGQTNTSHESDSLLAQKICLELVQRGSDLLTLSPQNEAPLACAIRNQREHFIAQLKGHPQFQFPLIKALRIGQREKPSDPQKPNHDSRRGILEFAVSSSSLPMVRSLINDAGWNINELGPSGKYPIGFAKNAPMCQLLLSLGANPALEDLQGENALARTQSQAENTVERDKMIGMIAKDMAKRGGASPALMEQLRAENVVALLEAAEKAPKSSLLKTISAFKFDPSKVQDPETGLTPLMAALRGGKLASAAHLLKCGCSFDTQDQKGRCAAAYALLGQSSPNGPSSIDLIKDWPIDWSARSQEGFSPLFQCLEWPESNNLRARATTLWNVIKLARNTDKLPELTRVLSDSCLIKKNGEAAVSVFPSALKLLLKATSFYDRNILYSFVSVNESALDLPIHWDAVCMTALQWLATDSKTDKQADEAIKLLMFCEAHIPPPSIGPLSQACAYWTQMDPSVMAQLHTKLPIMGTFLERTSLDAVTAPSHSGPKNKMSL